MCLTKYSEFFHFCPECGYSWVPERAVTPAQPAAGGAPAALCRLPCCGCGVCSDMPESPPHRLQQRAATGIWGGPTYRGAEIRCLPGGHACGLFLPEHPLH